MQVKHQIGRRDDLTKKKRMDCINATTTSLQGETAGEQLELPRLKCRRHLVPMGSTDQLITE